VPVVRATAAFAAAFAMTLACTAPRSTTTPAPARTTIRVVSFNIHAGTDAAHQPNLERVAAVLDTLDADVVLLQEVDRGTKRSGRVDQIAELERLTGLRGAFGKSLDFQGGDYGIAALSRWSIHTVDVVPLHTEAPAERGDGRYEPRVALHLVVSTPAGPLHVIGTHLGAEGDGTYRRQEALALLAHIRQDVPPGVALIVGGDFNSLPESNVVAAFSLAMSDAWTACGNGAGYTFPSDDPERRIDYIFLRGVHCLAARSPATMVSDHRPLFVTLEMPAPAR
jgi:Metal-dependent hydrolase